jgi:hypothetical protein
MTNQHCRWPAKMIVATRADVSVALRAMIGQERGARVRVLVARELLMRPTRASPGGQGSDREYDCGN